MRVVILVETPEKAEHLALIDVRRLRERLAGPVGPVGQLTRRSAEHSVPEGDGRI